MDFKSDPAFAWLYGDPKVCGRDFYREIVSPTELTRSIGGLLKILANGTTRPIRDELEDAWRFLALAYGGHFGKDDSNSFAACVERAAEMENFCRLLEKEVNRFEEFNPSATGFDQAAYMDSAHWILHYLVHLHYLRREIIFFVVFLPKANAKQRQESQIPGMSLADGKEIKKRNEQWNKWASELVKKRPELRGNKKGIAEELKKAHTIKQSEQTIRKALI